MGCRVLIRFSVSAVNIVIKGTSDATQSFPESNLYLLTSIMESGSVARHHDREVLCETNMRLEGEARLLRSGRKEDYRGDKMTHCCENTTWATYGYLQDLKMERESQLHSIRKLH